MNDNELCTAVRESVAGIHSVTPVTQIISRGRAVRTRRRIPALAGAVTAIGGTALALAIVLPSGSTGILPATAGSHSAVKLAAWTVSKQANGDIIVTINQLKNPEGLQTTLRADGLPATVNFSGLPMSASCQGYAASKSTLSAVADFHSTYLSIDPGALPSGTGVAIFDEPDTGFQGNPSGTVPTHGAARTHPSLGGPLLNATDGPLAVGIVYASQRCTG